MFDPMPTSWNPKTIEENGYSVTFVRNPACYPYLRETTMMWFFKSGVPSLNRLEKGGDHIVAYELPLDPKLLTGHKHVWCRTWKFNSSDPYFHGGVPDEAVRPCDIVPGKPTVRYQPLWQEVVLERLPKRGRGRK
jgi:hypothetical protein